jgi:hypothetical protein
MKKVISIMFMIVLIAGCRKMEVRPLPIDPLLNINTTAGIKLQTVFVTKEAAMNVKSEVAQTITIRIYDISNRVVSREVLDVKAGDNIVKVYTSALPRSAYRIAIFDSKGAMLDITDFNKL